MDSCELVIFGYIIKILRGCQRMSFKMFLIYGND